MGLMILLYIEKKFDKNTQIKLMVVLTFDILSKMKLKRQNMRG